MFTIYSSDVTGNPGNCSYPHKQVILDEDSLKIAISHDYVCAEYKNSYRNGDNFIGSDCLPVDCDNDHSENPEDWITPEDVMHAFPGVTFAVHYSRYNNKVKNGKPARPKFHVLFPIDYYGYIEKFIERLGERFNIREIAFDRWGAVQMVQNLENMGFTVVPFGQGFKDMSPPTKELMKLTLEEKLAHGGHPVLRWMMDNIYIRTDPAGNIKADKEKSTEKIDGAIATIMGLDRAIRCGNDSGASVYDNRGILFV